MRISWNWLSEWVDLSPIKGPSHLAELLIRRGLEVEQVESLGRGFEKVITAKILERAPHPQADRLSVCSVTVGSGEPLQIVCGAQNMKSGDKVALAQVGASLPNGVKIGESKIRGVLSFGMLCSEQELKLKDTSEGILILPPETQLGLPLADFLGKNDVILHLKVTANRGDCLSHLGIAREVAAALGQKLKKSEPQALQEGNCPVSIHLEAGDLAPQFFGCWIEGVQVGVSPDWLVRKLEAIGLRSINNVVDISNWVMLELGHPVHAYDGDEIRGRSVSVRLARKGEELPLLDQKTIQLTGSELVISDAERAIGLAGVMGGGNSEVQLSTHNLFLECAEFDPKLVRQTAGKYQRKTDAAHRFERGIDPADLGHVMSRFASEVLRLAGGRILGSQWVRGASRAGVAFQRPEIVLGLHEVHDFLGFERDQAPLTLDQVEAYWKGLNCQFVREPGHWRLRPPTYRWDLNIKEDLAEEIARTVGYDQIPATVPPLSSVPALAVSAISQVTLMDRVKDALVKLGFQESLNYAFTSRDNLEKVGLKSSVRLINPLSEEFEWMVPSLLSGLIRNAQENWNHHFGSESLPIRLFELRPVFSAAGPIESSGRMNTGVQESWKLAWVMSGPRMAGGLRADQAGVDFYDLKAVAESLFAELGTRGVRMIPFSASRTGGNPLFHPGKSAEVLAGNAVAGHFGLLHPAISRELKIKGELYLAELDWAQLLKLSRGAFQVPVFKSWSQFPGMERDFALVVKSDVTVDKICQAALKAGKPLIKEAKVFDIYRGSQVAEGMTSIAVRVIFYDETRSIQEAEAEAFSSKILDAWKKEFGAELRG